jgi:hypothetical protein
VSPTRRGGGRETAVPRARPREKNPPLRHARWRPRRLSDRQIRSEALHWLLPLLKSALRRTFRPAAVRDTADLLLRAAALRSSVHRARAQCRRGYSDRSARWLFGHLQLRRVQRALTLCLRRQIRPFVPFKSNSRGLAKGSPMWNRKYHEFQLKRDEFDEAYHKRSNVESTFSAIKRKLGEPLLSKTSFARLNELLAKILAYNIGVVIYQAHLHGLEPKPTDFIPRAIPARQAGEAKA